MKSFRWIASTLFLVLATSFAAEPAKLLELHTRSRVETVKGSDEFVVVEKAQQWDPRKTAIVICDMWDQHWCKGATARVAEMAPRMNEVIKEARKRGVFI